jgi:dipeptidyl-peptidase-3
MKIPNLNHKSQFRFYFKNALAATLSLSLTTATVVAAPESVVSKDGDFVLKQFVVPSFDRLPLNRKLFVYYLSKAIESGRDIAWKQVSREGLSIRHFFEGILRCSSSQLSAEEKKSLDAYLFRLYSNHMNYEEGSNKKFIPSGIDFAKVFELAVTADQKSSQWKELGVQAPKGGFQVEAKRLQTEIFDPSHKEFFHAPQDQDPLLSSATDFYGEGLSHEQLEKASQNISMDFMSYPTLKQNGEIRNRKHRIKGRFHAELSLIDFYLGKASTYANPQEVKIIAAHRRALRTGNVRDVISAEKLWAQYQSEDVEFVLGFTETYEDPLERRGSWEGFILVKELDEEVLQRNQKIEGNFDLFEVDSAIPAEYKKEKGAVAPKSQVAYMVFSGGSNGEQPFSGVNLPNWSEVHEKYGSKSFTVANVIDDIKSDSSNSTEEKKKTQEVNRTFYLPEYLPMLEEFDPKLVSELQVTFHEILGHGSGRNIIEKERALGSLYSPIEEGRAEVASLYHIAGSLVHQLDIIPKVWDTAKAERFGLLMNLIFFTSQLRSYTRLGEDVVDIRQSHQWARQMMLNWLIEREAIQLVRDGDITKVRISSMAKIRSSLGDLWAKLQVIKSTGKFKDAEMLLKAYGGYTESHRAIRREYVQAEGRLGLTAKRATFMNPELQLIVDQQGDPLNVIIHYQEKGFSVSDFVKREGQRSRFNLEVNRCKMTLSK